MKDDSNRSLRRVNRKSRSAADRTVEVDSSAFFAEDPSPTPPPRKKPGSSAPRRSGAPAQAAAAAPSKFGRILLPVQGILSVASLVQLWRTQMLPVLYLVILAALLFLLWLLVKRCQEYNVPGKVSRVFSVFLCACMALGCVWAQQGLTALDNMTNGLLTGAEANKITKEPFVIYLSGVDTRGELTAKHITEAYRLPEGMVTLLDQEQCAALEAAPAEDAPCCMYHQKGFASLTGGLRAADKAQNAETTATTVQMVSVLFSVAIAVLLTSARSIWQLPVTYVLMYQAAWSALSIAVCALKQHN